MQIIDWTGLYSIPRADIRGDLFFRHIDNEDDGPHFDHVDLYALYARVAYCYPMRILHPTSIMMTAGLTLGQVEVEIKFTTRAAGRRWPRETVDYSDLEFYGQKVLGLSPGDFIGTGGLRVPAPTEFFGISFR